MLERLPGAEVGCERKGTHHLGSADRPLTEGALLLTAPGSSAFMARSYALTVRQTTLPGDRAERFHGDRQPAPGLA